MQNLLINAVDVFFELLYLLIMVRIVFSWLPALYNSAVGEMIFNLTEPILGPVREMVRNSPIGGGMMLDFSPIIALFIMKIGCSIIKAVIMVIL